MIDLRSDTVTQPTPEMKQAMMNAELGDDMYGDDPTVNHLEKMVADLLGTEAAVFACSGTQSNQMALRAHCVPGDELLINATGHIGNYEAGGPAALSGITVRQIDAPRGMLNVEHLQTNLKADDQHYCPTTLVCLENTTNIAGGYVYPLRQIQDMADWTQTNNLKLHLDGARFFNACVAGEYSAEELARHFDTISICFSKGLGCPMGSILAGSTEDMQKARRARKMFGGALRQAGIIAAAAIYALENNIDRLQQDHDNAQTLATELAKIDGITASADETESNLVFFEVAAELGTAQQLNAAIRERGVRLSPLGTQRLRAATHLDVSAADIRASVDAVQDCIQAGFSNYDNIDASPYSR